MVQDYGEPLRHDPEFKGPVHNRSCTDILWLILFILFMGGWGYVGYYGYTRGDVERLLAPMDTLGQRCGLDSSLIDRKYLVFFDIAMCLSPTTPLTGCNTPQVCVERCPERTIIFNEELNAATFEQLRSSFVCTYDVNVATMTLQQAQENISVDKCARYVLQSQPVLGRCIGDLSTKQCRSSTAAKGMSGSGSAASCDRNAQVARRKALADQATALDSYVGLIVASFVTFFTRNDISVDIVVLGRCFINATEAVEKLTEITETLGLTEAQVSEQMANLIKLNQLSTQIVEDLVQSRWYMLGGLVAVVVLCMIYIMLLRWVVAPVVWFSIVALLALLSFSVYLCYVNYAHYKANPVTVGATTNVVGYARSIFTMKETWLAMLIIVAIVLIILTLVVIFLRSRIVIAIALIKEGSKAVGSNKSTMAFPLFSWIIQCFVIVFGVLVLMFLLSIGETTFSVVGLSNDTTCNCNGVYTRDYESCNPMTFAASCHDISSTAAHCRQAFCHFTGISNPTVVTYMHIVNVVGFFWMMAFISGVADMMLASTFSTWYWTFHKSDLPFFTLTAGIYRTVRYHLGTVALGALIIAIVQTIRVCIEYINHKLNKFDNAFTRCILTCCRCCFYCLENFLKFINKNAYIMCAVHGKNFCRSARDAFSLLMRNIVRVVVLDKVTDFIFFLSKLLISIGVGIGVYYLMEWNYIYEVTQGHPLHYNYVPAIILAIATYLITTIFFNVYAMAVDTLFLCFLEDCERNDGSAEKPYFMSKNLMRILGKKNKIN